ncbi:Holliday junction resolvase RuvX [Metamycoplasma canadense]|uniref:Putative pre-16S rRNA nuclease n=1 Tax=Metamycoplasma canadense TaxID=29554 RepID=A0A077L6X1_9BACT|nr:Holliday junction resolvase RuvX [Metamycoplasma canadense]BAP39546.1 putative Holliday junction resolvase [Metamycoplasma canadense]
MRKLGLDLGSKTCGIAITDLNNIIVSALETFYFEEWHFIDLIKRIGFWINESEYKNEIDTIVLGYPLRMDLSKSPRTKMVEKFKVRLEENFKINVILQDERESTIFAENILFEAGFNGKKRKIKKDSLAAQIILEDYLKRG